MSCPKCGNASPPASPLEFVLVRAAVAGRGGGFRPGPERSRVRRARRDPGLGARAARTARRGDARRLSLRRDRPAAPDRRRRMDAVRVRRRRPPLGRGRARTGADARPRADPAPALGAQPLDRRIRRLRSVRARTASVGRRLGRASGPAGRSDPRDDLAVGLRIRPGAAIAARADRPVGHGGRRDCRADPRFLPVAPAEPALAGGSPASLDAAIGAVVAAVADLYDITTPLRYKVEALRRDTPKVGRNDPCPCGSGRKFKQCHGAASATPR